jgi:hypothetical protein
VAQRERAVLVVRQEGETKAETAQAVGLRLLLVTAI